MAANGNNSQAVASQPNPSHAQSMQFVVVWEWEAQPGKFKSYSPNVCKVLEAAQRKKLSQVFLGDTDPNLSRYKVSLTKMVQVDEVSGEAASIVRKLYPKSSPPGTGVRWDWLGDRPGAWHSYDTDVIVVIEEYYSAGQQTLDLSLSFPHLPYIINFCNLTQVRKDSGFVRSMRRVTQAPYPLATKQEVATMQLQTCGTSQTSKKRSTPKVEAKKKSVEGASGPKMESKVLSGLFNGLHSLLNHGGNNSTGGVSSGGTHGGLHLTINKDESKKKGRDMGLRVERRARSSSLETVSTRLSHESRDDDLDVIIPRSRESRSTKPKLHTIYKRVAEPARSLLLTYTAEVSSPNAENCQLCLNSCQIPSGLSQFDNTAAFTQCGHTFHADCLISHVDTGKTTFTVCPSCKTFYGIKTGTQPEGTMQHTIQDFALPGYPHTQTIEIIYSFKPGVQGPEHPIPGMPYYAPGFPRKLHLPDTQLGRKVLNLLYVAFERRLLFTVGRSVTTGEDFVIKSEIGPRNFDKHVDLDKLITQLKLQGVY